MEEDKKDSCSSWTYLTFVSLVTFFVFGFLDSYGVLLVFLVEYFSEKNSKAAWVGSSAMFGCFFLYPLALRMRYKFGIRITVLLAGALLLPVFLISPVVQNIDLLFFTFSIPFAIAGSIISCATFTTIQEYFERCIGVAFGVRAGANALGIIMFSFTLPILLTEIGWKRAFWILTGICFITICYALVYYESESVADTPSRRIHLTSISSEIMPPKDLGIEDIRIYCRLFKNKELVLYLVANTIFALVVFMPPVFMVQFVTKLGYGIAKSKWLMVTRGIAAVITRFTAGSFVDLVFRRRKVRFISLFVMLLFSLSTILCSLTESFSMFLCYMAFVSIVDSIHWIVIPLLTKEITRDVNPEHAYALFNCVGSFATLGGPPLLGWLYDSTGDFRHVLYVVSAVSSIAACLIALRLCLATDSVLSTEIVEEIMNEQITDTTDMASRSTIVHMPVQFQYLTVV